MFCIICTTFSPPLKKKQQYTTLQEFAEDRGSHAAASKALQQLRPPLSVTIDHSDQHFISGGGHGVALSLCLRVPQTPHIIFLIIMQR